MEFDPARSAGFLANQMARLFAQALAREVKPLGLAPAQFMTLLALWERDGQTQAELTARLDVEQATMANTLSRMVRDGLVERAPHPSDRRASLIRMTAKARALEAPAKTRAEAINRRALEGLSEAERAQFLDLMAHAIARLGGGPPGPVSDDG